MTIEVRLHPNAFNVGGRWEEFAEHKHKMTMQFGTLKDWPHFIPTVHNRNYNGRHPGTFEFRVHVNARAVEDADWDMWYKYMPNHIISSIAAAVRAELVELRKDGIVKTADEILLNTI